MFGLTTSSDAAALFDARAKLLVRFEVVAAAFRQFAETRGLEVRGDDGGLSVRLRLGLATLTPNGEATVLELQSPDAVSMQLLRDTIAGRVADFGIDIEWLDKAKRGRPANFSLARVTEVRRLTPSYTRVVIDGPDLARFAQGSLHFRLLFGPDGADWPFTDEGGVTQWPGGPEAWHRPVYTTRQISPRHDGSAEIDFDVFLHEGGRVTEWTRRIQSGEEIGLTGPGGGRGPGAASHHLLIGDETAVPVIARILSDISGDAKGQAFLFVTDPGDIQDLRKPDGISVEWCLRGTRETPLSVMECASLPASDRFVFFAGERSDVFAARDRLLATGFRRTEFHAATYWTAD